MMDCRIIPRPLKKWSVSQASARIHTPEGQASKCEAESQPSEEIRTNRVEGFEISEHILLRSMCAGANEYVRI